MILVTIDHVPGRAVVACLGIVTSEALVGMEGFSDMIAAAKDPRGFQAEQLFEAREEALSRLASHAEARGADAVIGVCLDYEQIAASSGLLLVAAQGTAVRLAAADAAVS